MHRTSKRHAAAVLAGSAAALLAWAVPAEAGDGGEEKAMKPSAEAGYTVEIRQLEAQPTAVIRFEVSTEKISMKLAEVLPAVYGYVTAEGVELASQPLSRYFGEADGVLEMEAGIATAEAVEPSGEIRPSELPAGPAAVTWHVGPYDRLAAAHEALESWAEENGRTPGGAPWEIYVTDPGQEPDPNLWRTQVFLPLEGE